MLSIKLVKNRIKGGENAIKIQNHALKKMTRIFLMERKKPHLVSEMQFF